MFRTIIGGIFFLGLLVSCGESDKAVAPGVEESGTTIDTVIASFKEAWQANDSIGLEKTFASSAMGQIMSDLDVACERYGWDVLDLPKLGEPKQLGVGSNRVVTFPVGNDALEVKMEESSAGWVITSLKPNVTLNLKSADQVVADFMTTWNKSDLDGVYKSLTPAMFERKSSFEKLFARRGWTEKLPEIAQPSIEGIDDFQFKATFFIGSAGELQCKWIVEGGRWGLRTLRPPKK